MAAITRLHPYQNRAIASALDAVLFGAEHRRALSARTLSFYHSNNPVNRVEAKHAVEKLPDQLNGAISPCSIRQLPLPRNLTD